MREDEKRVLRALERKYKQPFEECQLDCGTREDGQTSVKKFDAVSMDKKIIAMVKNYSAKNMQGNRTRLARVMHDIVLLLQADGQTRLMYLSPEFYAWFKSAHDAPVPRGIEIKKIPQ